MGTTWTNGLKFHYVLKLGNERSILNRTVNSTRLNVANILIELILALE